jgi:hypothetical protein
LLRNKHDCPENLKLGWYAVRNRAPDEVKDESPFNERDLREAALFSKGIWRDNTSSDFHKNPPISRKVLGIENLKAALSQALLKAVKEGFPSLREEMGEMKQDIKQQLGRLGESRSTETLQRAYIYSIQASYQRELERSVRGDYRRDIDENHPSKLSLHIEELNRKFNEDMLRDGAKHVFSPPTGDDNPLVSLNGQAMDSKEDILPWIRQVCRNTRGSEPQHDLPPLIKRTLFLVQIESWEKIAKSYLKQIETVIEECAQHLFKTACEDDRLRGKLRGMLYNAYHSGLNRARAELNNIIQDHGYLRTWNPMLDSRISELSAQREKPAVNISFLNGTSETVVRPNNLQGNAFATNAPFSQPAPAPSQVPSPFSFGRTTSSASAPPQVPDTTRQNRMGGPQAEILRSHVGEKDIIKLHDWIWAYYDVALPRFVDNVTTQVVQRHLMGLKGPVRVFNPEWVIRLTPAELEDLAGEDEDTKMERVILQERLDGLEEAIEKAERVSR